MHFLECRIFYSVLVSIIVLSLSVKTTITTYNSNIDTGANESAINYRVTIFFSHYMFGNICKTSTDT